MKHPIAGPPGVRIFFAFGLLTLLFTACCPTGAYEDNFGRFYTLVTIPGTDFEQTMLTTGQVDTRDLGCGVWSIRAPTPVEPPPDPENPIAWVAVNPNQNTADQCCWAFRFDGNDVQGSGCGVILGEYRNIGGKCEQSGPMFLQNAP